MTIWPSTSAVARAPAGAALVVDVGDERELGYWGEVLTTAAESRGIAGLVIDGCVRDCRRARGPRVPGVLHRPGACRARRRTAPARSVGSGVTVGDVAVEPGDWVVGDADGVVVVPGDALDAGAGRGPLAGGRRRSATSPTLRDGATTLELLGLDAGLIDGA